MRKTAVLFKRVTCFMHERAERSGAGVDVVSAAVRTSHVGRVEELNTTSVITHDFQRVDVFPWKALE
jgi:hypothetical protein